MSDFSQSSPPVATLSGPGGTPSGSVPWATFTGTGPDRTPVQIPPGMLDCIRTTTDRIWKQFEGQPNWEKLFLVVADVFCAINDQQRQMWDRMHLSTGTGVVLDWLGESIKLNRNGLSDDLFRPAIRAEAASLLVSGQGDELLDLMSTLFPDLPSTLEEWFPAAIKLCIPGLTADQFGLLIEVLGDSISGAVAGVLETYDDSRTAGHSSSVPGEVFPWGAYGYPGLTDDEAVGIFSLNSYSQTIGI